MDWLYGAALLCALLNDALDLFLDLAFPLEFLLDIATMLAVFWALSERLGRAGLRARWFAAIPLMLAEVTPGSDIMPLVLPVSAILLVINSCEQGVAADLFEEGVGLLSRDVSRGVDVLVRLARLLGRDEERFLSDLAAALRAGSPSLLEERWGERFRRAGPTRRGFLRVLAALSLLALLLDVLTDLWYLDVVEQKILEAARAFLSAPGNLELVMGAYEAYVDAYEAALAALLAPQLLLVILKGWWRPALLALSSCILLLNPLTPFSLLNYFLPVLALAASIEPEA